MSDQGYIICIPSTPPTLQLHINFYSHNDVLSLKTTLWSIPPSPNSIFRFTQSAIPQDYFALNKLSNFSAWNPASNRYSDSPSSSSSGVTRLKWWRERTEAGTLYGSTLHISSRLRPKCRSFSDWTSLVSSLARLTFWSTRSSRSRWKCNS